MQAALLGQLRRTGSAVEAVQAVDQSQTAHQSAHARFKNRKALSRRRHEDTLVLADGQNGDWTPHDLRRTGATMMQALGGSLDVIDRCQNHVLAGSRVRRHYLHHDYAEEKKRAWNLLGDRLSAVLSSTYEHSPAESMMSFPAYTATGSLPPS
ncbi:hypothetical protein D3C84_703220 [compost metagenome]